MDQMIGKYVLYESVFKDRVGCSLLKRETADFWVFEDRWEKEFRLSKAKLRVYGVFDDVEEGRDAAKYLTQRLLDLKSIYNTERAKILETYR